MTRRSTAPESISLTSVRRSLSWSVGFSSTGSTYVTVLPTAPSAAFIACASACISGGCSSPAMTRHAPLCALRSAAILLIWSSGAAAPPAGAERDAVVGEVAGVGRRRLYRVEPTYLARLAVVGAAARGEVARVPERARAAFEEVRVERKHAVGRGEVVGRRREAARRLPNS